MSLAHDQTTVNLISARVRAALSSLHTLTNIPESVWLPWAKEHLDEEYFDASWSIYRGIRCTRLLRSLQRALEDTNFDWQSIGSEDPRVAAAFKDDTGCSDGEGEREEVDCGENKWWMTPPGVANPSADTVHRDTPPAPASLTGDHPVASEHNSPGGAVSMGVGMGSADIADTQRQIEQMEDIRFLKPQLRRKNQLRRKKVAAKSASILKNPDEKAGILEALSTRKRARADDEGELQDAIGRISDGATGVSSQMETQLTEVNLPVQRRGHKRRACVRSMPTVEDSEEEPVSDKATQKGKRPRSEKEGDAQVAAETKICKNCRAAGVEQKCDRSSNRACTYCRLKKQKCIVPGEPQLYITIGRKKKGYTPPSPFIFNLGSPRVTPVASGAGRELSATSSKSVSDDTYASGKPNGPSESYSPLPGGADPDIARIWREVIRTREDVVALRESVNGLVRDVIMLQKQLKAQD
ncbi:hypothetical protein BKA93DRAFT_799020 [Sparassis latifolia]